MTHNLPFDASRAAFLQELQDAHAVEGGTLVVNAVNAPPEHFVQFLFWDQNLVAWEVGTYLEVGRIWRKLKIFLTLEQQALLEAHGFRYDRKESPNYMRIVEIAGPETLQQIVDESCEILFTVYGIDPASELCFERIV